MSSAVSVCSDEPADQANAWLAEHHDELCSRARVQFGSQGLERREESVCEALAIIAASAHSAARRDTLHRLSPSTCMHYAVKQIKAGRRAAGYSATDALSEATRIKHGVEVGSLDAASDDEGRRQLTWHEALADRDAEQPVEVIRRRHDLGLALSSGKVSTKARQVFVALAQSAGKIRQKDLAMDLGVSAGRLTQIKGELASTLATFGYTSPLGRRPASV
jgi:hypothetical protein